jgi:hypothetical protein
MCCVHMFVIKEVMQRTVSLVLEYLEEALISL